MLLDRVAEPYIARISAVSSTLVVAHRALLSPGGLTGDFGLAGELGVADSVDMLLVASVENRISEKQNLEQGSESGMRLTTTAHA